MNVSKRTVVAGLAAVPTGLVVEASDWRPPNLKAT